MRNPPPPPEGNRAGNATAITLSVIRFFTTLVDRFGWPGAFLFAIGAAVQNWGSAEQKHELIDKYLLGHGMNWWWPLVVPSLLFLLLIWAQRLLNKKELRKCMEEMRRIGAEKSALQELLAGRPLRHRPPNILGD